MLDAEKAETCSESGFNMQAEAPEQDFKHRLFAAVIRHRKAVIVIFAICAVVGLACKPLVGVNYDMNSYLPADSASTIALDVMEEEFDGDIPNARVMVRDVSIPQALEMKERLAAVSGVTSVTWLDDVVSTEVPLEMLDADTVGDYYCDGNALFSLSIDDASRIEACEEIREIVGDEAALTGSAVSAAIATESTVSEIRIIAVCAVAFLLLVLVLTTTNWLVPLLVLAGLGVAIAINSGTNLIFGEISFVTNAAGAILQLAISLDFSVFLLHRYEECRGLTASAQGDMVEALCKSSTAILSSACTVMIGFLALSVMQFQIGPDLGLALAKGIAISLVTVFTFTPSLLVCADCWMRKATHRPFLPSMRGFGRFVGKVCVPLAAVFVLLAVPAYLASTSDDIKFYYGSSHIFDVGTQYGDDTAAIEEVFGKTDTYAVMVPTGDVAREKELAEALEQIPAVSSVVSYVTVASSTVPSAMAPASTLSKVQSENYSRLVLTVDAAYEGDETVALVETVRNTAAEYYPGQCYVAGEGVSTADLRATILEDKVTVDWIAIVAVIIVLLIALRSLSLPIILVFVIETSIWLGFSIPYFTGQGEFYLAYLIVSTIQLGVTVDYAILLTDRYREMRRTHLKKDALVGALEHTTIPILTSGVVLVVVGFVMSAVSSHGVLAQLGYFLGCGVSLSLLAVLFVLPGFLYALDGLIAKTTYKARFLRPRSGEADECASKTAEHAMQ